jgi:hypothetical protein
LDDLLGLKLGEVKSLVDVLMPQKFESIWINLACTSFTGFKLSRNKTELFCKIFELGHGIFLDIWTRYDPRNFRELFENFLSIKSIGCFTTHSDDLNSQIKKMSYWKRFK